MIFLQQPIIFSCTSLYIAFSIFADELKGVFGFEEER